MQFLYLEYKIIYKIIQNTKLFLTERLKLPKKALYIHSAAKKEHKNRHLPEIPDFSRAHLQKCNLWESGWVNCSSSTKIVQTQS